MEIPVRNRPDIDFGAFIPFSVGNSFFANGAEVQDHFVNRGDRGWRGDVLGRNPHDRERCLQ